jgi:hypothetical protein
VRRLWRGRLHDESSADRRRVRRFGRGGLHGASGAGRRRVPWLSRGRLPSTGHKAGVCGGSGAVGYMTSPAQTAGAGAGPQSAKTGPRRRRKPVFLGVGPSFAGVGPFFWELGCRLPGWARFSGSWAFACRCGPGIRTFSARICAFSPLWNRLSRLPVSWSWAFGCWCGPAFLGVGASFVTVGPLFWELGLRPPGWARLSGSWGFVCRGEAAFLENGPACVLGGGTAGAA